MKLSFWKLECAGNDFVFIPRKSWHRGEKLKQFVQEICVSHKGVAADGLVYIWKDKNKWQWRFYNADGSEVALCGNAARGVVFWLAKHGAKKQAKSLLKWHGKLGQFSGRLVNKSVTEVTWPTQKYKATPLPEELSEQLHGFNDRGYAGAFLLNVGNPHLVLLNHDVWTVQDRKANNATLRHHPCLGVEGANVTWLSLQNRETVTFERGVERETLSCGSGAVAAFLAERDYLQISGQKVTNKSSFNFPGGKLSVFEKLNTIWLQGPVREVFHGELVL